MDNERIVSFDLYCHKCKYADYHEEEEPCCDCLDVPINDETDRPLYYKEKETKK